MSRPTFETAVLLDIVWSHVIIVLKCLEQLKVCSPVQPLKPVVLLDIVWSHVIIVLKCLQQSMSRPAFGACGIMG